MSSQIISQFFRIILVMAIQVLLLKRIDLQIGSFNYIHLFLYPLLILFIPVKTPRALLLIIAFFIGLGLDFFYDSIGIHASAALFLAYSRKYILKILEPIEGYNIEQRLTINALGFPWILTYVSILLFLYCLWYFSVEAFSFVYFKEIILRTISSFIASYVLIILFLIIFNPKN